MPKISKFKRLALLGATVFALTDVHAAITITEVAPYASGNTAYAADWFELTNTGTSAVDITGWTVDDSSNLLSASLALQGVTSIAAGQSVIFLEGNSTGSNFATKNADFKTAWFGANAPAGLLIGNYGGAGIGLSTSGDAINIFNSSGVNVASISFGASTSGTSFDNAAGLSGMVTQLSVVGVNGAFTAFSGTEIGSPGNIAAVPEPETYALMLAGLGLIATIARKRRQR